MSDADVNSKNRNKETRTANKKEEPLQILTNE
jgi:hypothetical protein